MRYRLKSDPSVWCDVEHPQDHAVTLRISGVGLGRIDTVIIPNWLFHKLWEPVPTDCSCSPKKGPTCTVKPFHHFDSVALFKALCLLLDHRGRFQSTKDGRPCQTLYSFTVVEYVAGKMLDPAVRAEVLKARRTEDGSPVVDESSDQAPPPELTKTEIQFHGRPVWIEGNTVVAKWFSNHMRPPDLEPWDYNERDLKAGQADPSPSPAKKTPVALYRRCPECGLDFLSLLDPCDLSKVRGDKLVTCPNCELEMSADKMIHPSSDANDSELPKGSSLEEELDRMAGRGSGGVMEFRKLDDLLRRAAGEIRKLRKQAASPSDDVVSERLDPVVGVKQSNVEPAVEIDWFPNPTRPSEDDMIGRPAAKAEDVAPDCCKRCKFWSRTWTETRFIRDDKWVSVDVDGVGNIPAAVHVDVLVHGMCRRGPEQRYEHDADDWCGKFKGKE